MHVATPSRTCCFGTTVTYSNLQGLTVPPRTVRWKYITTNLGSRQEHSCTDLASRQSTGPLPFATQYTFTIGWSITKLKSHLSKDTTECARIYHDLKYSALAFVLNGPVTAPENSITIRSQAFFWVTLQPIITSTTLTSRPVSLKPAIMQSLTKHGTSRHNVRRLLNFYMILVWNSTPMTPRFHRICS